MKTILQYTQSLSLQKALDFMKRDEAILVLLLFALVAQIPHTAAVLFHATQPIFGLIPVTWIFAYLGALAIDMAIFMMVIRGKTFISWLFAAFAVMVNLVHFWKPGFATTPNQHVAEIAGMILAAALIPLIIALYSHEVEADDTITQTATPKPTKRSVDRPAKSKPKNEGSDKMKSKDKILAWLRENGGIAKNMSDLAEKAGVSVATVSRNVGEGYQKNDDGTIAIVHTNGDHS